MKEGQVPRGRIRRTMPLAGFTARAAGGRLVAGLREKAGDTGAVERFHEKTAERYTELLGHSKGVLMKAGQMFSTIDSSFSWDGAPSPYQKAMSRLQTQSPPMAPELARQILESELGQPIGKVFATFDAEPLSSASIGQVHRAVLHDGRQVAVKIQYPGVAQAIRDDLANTELLITFLRLALSLNGQSVALDMRSAASEISRQIAEEVDYHREAANIGAFSELLRGHPFIRVPEVIPEASGARVLTMTFVDGMGWAQAQQADQQLKDRWGEALWRFAITPLFHQSSFYPDLHPGNYLFAEDGTLGIVDFGSVKPLPERLRMSWCRMVSAYIDNRRADLRGHMDEIGFFAADPTVTADECHAWMSESNAALQMPQPVTFSAEVVDRFFAMMDTDKPDNIVRRLVLPPDLIFFVRMPLGVQSVLSRLGATLEIRSIVRDMLGVADPTTALGVQHVSWLRERGLPFGLDSREQIGAQI